MHRNNNFEYFLWEDLFFKSRNGNVFQTQLSRVKDKAFRKYILHTEEKTRPFWDPASAPITKGYWGRGGDYGFNWGERLSQLTTEVRDKSSTRSFNCFCCADITTIDSLQTSAKTLHSPSFSSSTLESALHPGTNMIFTTPFKWCYFADEKKTPFAYGACLNISLPLVLVSLGTVNKYHTLGAQTSLFSQVWRPEVQGQCAGRFNFFGSLCLWLVDAVFLLCPHMSALCACLCPNHIFL